MALLRSLLNLGLLFLVGSATALVAPRQAGATVVYRFSGGASAENLGVRSNGQILVTRLDAGEVWLVDPTAKTGSKLVSITGTTATAGIVELAADVWYVQAGKYSGGRNTAGSWGIYKIDMNAASPTAVLVKTMTDSKLINGMAKFDDDTLLIGDAQAGTLYHMSASTGDYSAIISADSTMVPGAGIPFGIDGLKYANGTAYFTNISKDTFSKVTIDASFKAGKIQSILTGQQGDDLCFDAAGNAYIATNSPGNGVIKVDPSGKATKLAGSVSGSSATAFGRTDATKNTLYITGTGELASITVS